MNTSKNTKPTVATPDLDAATLAHLDVLKRQRQIPGVLRSQTQTRTAQPQNKVHRSKIILKISDATLGNV